MLFILYFVFCILYFAWVKGSIWGGGTQGEGSIARGNVVNFSGGRAKDVYGGGGNRDTYGYFY